MFGRVALYRLDEALTWARAQLKPPRRSIRLAAPMLVDASATQAANVPSTTTEAGYGFREISPNPQDAILLRNDAARAAYGYLTYQKNGQTGS
jgi:hypothetical protein